MTTDTQAVATAAHSGSAATEAFRESGTRRETAAADSARIDLVEQDDRHALAVPLKKPRVAFDADFSGRNV